MVARTYGFAHAWAWDEIGELRWVWRGTVADFHELVMVPVPEAALNGRGRPRLDTRVCIDKNLTTRGWKRLHGAVLDTSDGRLTFDPVVPADHRSWWRPVLGDYR
ncbi:hypothetical protein ACFHW2_28475 [Actinomadura sp. LOL_016]|uniref:hypothetical protein n=1 Tax=unclassified Actinomadura TaxID=2626254 RepID=UPI003A801EF6